MSQDPASAEASHEVHASSYAAERSPTRSNATAARLGRGVITVVPITSNVDRVYPFQVLLPADVTGLEWDSKAQAEQVRSVAIERVGRRCGSLPPALVGDVDRALCIHLSL